MEYQAFKIREAHAESTIRIRIKENKKTPPQLHSLNALIELGQRVGSHEALGQALNRIQKILVPQTPASQPQTPNPDSLSPLSPAN
mmetsp:Transcript_44839/g.70221  ORF Transcript_44839/g.70221 Transcript_44839/m.70221 type:complete len:86 (-) Transcript_44839:127-384(-)